MEVPFVRYDNRESIKEVKAQVFNLDAAGKVQKTEVHNQWVDINLWKESRFTTSVKLDFTKATGELKCRYEGYSAMDARYDWYQQKEKYTPFEKASEVGEQQVALGTPAIEGLEELEKPFELKYSFALDTTESDLLYLNLSNWSHFAEMPFKAPTRTFPVELDYPVLENFLLTITLPAGYTVESLPKEVAVQLIRVKKSVNLLLMQKYIKINWLSRRGLV